jgi:hypothetical protein
MCFSATASFTAAVGLSALGIVTLKKTHTQSEVFFGMIPLLFGIQQFIEGIIWLSLTYNLPWLNVVMAHLFALFAYVLWPILVPIAVLSLEKKGWRKNALYLLELFGIGVASYFLYFLFKFPVSAQAVGRCLVYSTPHVYIIPMTVLYIAVTCFSLLISTSKTIKWFGLLATVFLFITYLFFEYALVSVWCFFAAILSSVVYLYFEYS